MRTCEKTHSRAAVLKLMGEQIRCRSFEEQRTRMTFSKPRPIVYLTLTSKLSTYQNTHCQGPFNWNQEPQRATNPVVKRAMNQIKCAVLKQKKQYLNLNNTKKENGERRMLIMAAAVTYTFSRTAVVFLWLHASVFCSNRGNCGWSTATLKEDVVTPLSLQDRRDRKSN